MRFLLAMLLACNGTPPVPVDGHDSAGDGGVESGDPAVVLPDQVVLPVTVTLDGSPVHGATVSQGSNPVRWVTDSGGQVDVTYVTGLEGDQLLMGSHPEARILSVDVEDALDAVGEDGVGGPLTIALFRYDDSDNPDYRFQDPGEPDRRDTTAQCAHCHITITDAWYESAHRQAASNPVVHDLYAGAAHAYGDAESCAEAGGTWATGTLPGTGASGERCYLFDGALDLLNDCGDGPCDAPERDVTAGETGDCAACHAPGIDGELHDRDLLEATGLSYDYGVHCDVCHKVESVDVASTAPGVEGRLRILRPSEPSVSPAFGDWSPLQFGPYDDVPNPRMGSVARPELFASAALCSGCHEYDQPVRVEGAEVDSERWPDGTLPVHSTFSEWLAGPYGADLDGADLDGGSAYGEGGAPCQSCHMPADGDVGNSADLGNIQSLEQGVAAGWWRSPGAVREHAWYGPRSDDVDMLGLAASLRVDAAIEAESVAVSATVANVGPGHALPTGDPLRHMILVVQATCDGTPLEPVGGDVVADYGGIRDEKAAGEDWSRWPGARVGDRIRVLSRPGGFHAYTGPAPFDGSRFDDAEQGLPVEELRAEAEVLAVDGELVTLDRALPAGDLALRVDGFGLPVDGETPRAWAGAPGFSFARVMVGADGARMVPHHAAVDVASDNRLLPGGGSFTSGHDFAPCAGAVEIEAALLYRPYPLALAEQRAWTLPERVMASAVLDLGGAE